MASLQSRNQGRASERYIDSCMREKSELFSSTESGDFQPCRLNSHAVTAHITRDLLEIALVFAFILVAVWTPPGRVNSFFSIVAAACIMAFAIAGRWGPREMGLTWPLSGAVNILLAGALLCGAIAAIGTALRFAGAGNALPWSRSWQYALWALQQEFILQSGILPTLAELISARNHSRNPRTYHRRQPTRQMAASYARGDWVFDDAFVKKSWGWTRCETNLLGTIRAVDDLCHPDFGEPGELP